MRDPYDVLGVSRTADAKTIKQAYRRLAKKHHPDQNRDDPRAKERFAEASQAYEIIGDEKKRGQYDRGEIGADGKPRFSGFEGGGDPFAGFRRGAGRGPGGAQFEFRSGPGGPAGMEDMFGNLFGDAFAASARGGSAARGGGDVEAMLDVTLEEAASGATVVAQMPDGRKLSVKLPAYVEDGQVIRLKGQGRRSALGAGDAMVTVKFARHADFEVKGRDLHVDVAVPLADAVLGGKIAVRTLTGRVALAVPRWSSSDRVLRLKGRGLPVRTGGHGDLFAHVRIMLPEADDDLEALMTRRAAARAD